MKKIFQILAILILITISFIGYKWYIHYKLSSKFFRYSSVTSPEAKAKLTELNIITTQLYKTETLGFDDVKFQIPTDKPIIRTEDKENSFKIETDGKTVIFINAINKKIDFENTLLKLAYGYFSLKSVYNQNPDNINFFDSEETLKKEYDILALKTRYLPQGGEKYLGYFEKDDIKGFQACKPELPQCNNIFIEIFIKDKTNPIIFILKGFSQDEINYILQSI